MPTTPTARPSLAHPSDRPLAVTALAALVGGGALVVDTVTITVINDAFGVLDDLLLWVGLAGLLVALVGLAVAVGSRTSGARRAVQGVAAFVAAFVVIGVLAQLADVMGRHLFSTANRGLHGEWSFFTVGVCLLLLAGWANRGRHRQVSLT